MAIQQYQYGEKIKYKKWSAIKLPDFSICLIKKSEVTKPPRTAPMTYEYFIIFRGFRIKIILWSAGHGLICPVPFKFKRQAYVLEKTYSNYFDWLKHDEIVLWPRKIYEEKFPNAL